MTPAAYFDTRFVELSTDAEGVSMLVLEYQGEPLRLHTVHAPRDAAGDHPLLIPGAIGAAELVPDAVLLMRPLMDQVPRLRGEPFYRFTCYRDQTLRRAPELDGADPAAVAEGRVPNVIGWRASGRAFRAPVGLMPGEGGGFIPDRTVPVTLRVPPEFVDRCAEFGLSAETVLRGFIADAAGLQNYTHTPRADGYSSNGSDERQQAEDWMERAYAHHREEAEQWAAAREQAVEDFEVREARIELLEDILAELEGQGVDVDAAIERMRAVIEQHGGDRGP